MKDIFKYDGAVFFVDILGFGALTKGEINLKVQDLRAWLSKEYPRENQYLAAALLAQFRHILLALQKKHRQVKIAQLSDCAFIWSANVEEVVVTAGAFMQDAIASGLLVRGGMAYGEIIETDQPSDLGRFIVGSAVTEAVKLEGLAKGARVLVNVELPSYVGGENHNGFGLNTIPLFGPFTNPLDYQIYDEFKWYLVHDLELTSKNYSFLTQDEKVIYTKWRLKLAALVWRSPLFSWNARSAQGRVHLNATIRFLSSNCHLELWHPFEWTTLVNLENDRQKKRVQSLWKSIDRDMGYKPLPQQRDDELFEEDC